MAFYLIFIDNNKNEDLTSLTRYIKSAQESVSFFLHEKVNKFTQKLFKIWFQTYLDGFGDFISVIPN